VKCPVCETKNEENVKNCKECEFEFVYFLSKPTVCEEENYKLKIENAKLQLKLNILGNAVVEKLKKFNISEIREEIEEYANSAMSESQKHVEEIKKEIEKY